MYNDDLLSADNDGIIKIWKLPDQHVERYGGIES